MPKSDFARISTIIHASLGFGETGASFNKYSSLNGFLCLEDNCAQDKAVFILGSSRKGKL